MLSLFFIAVAIVAAINLFIHRSFVMSKIILWFTQTGHRSKADDLQHEITQLTSTIEFLKNENESVDEIAKLQTQLENLIKERK